MKVSVIAPNLNDAAYLRLFLDSVKGQTYKDYEVIIVDGGSVDDSVEICWKYGVKVVVDRKRNIGYIRNVGASYAQGEIMLHTNSDSVLPCTLIKHLVDVYRDKTVDSVTGRTIPLNASASCRLAYYLFDLLRYVFTLTGKYRPGGSFVSVRSFTFRVVGGFPEVKVNEDGRFGERLEGFNTFFKWNLYAGHHAKRFKHGFFNTIKFYSYVFGNYGLRFLFKHIEAESAETFADR